MAKQKKVKSDALALCKSKNISKRQKPYVHVFGKGFVCDTDTKGHATPDSRSPAELVVDASNGVIPLWAEGQTLRWRFKEDSLLVFRDPQAARQQLRWLFGEGVLLWGPFTPIQFSERSDNWDFEIAVSPQDNCSANGCVLASAFFPDSGRHQLTIYPKMFSQSETEQIETMAHEIGHIFGLRHFFAKVNESAWPSEIFGTHSKFSIMNYGADSYMTQADRDDLKLLYEAVWSGQLTEINGTKIEQVVPFSATHGFQQFQPTRLAAAGIGPAMGAAIGPKAGNEKCCCQMHCKCMRG